MLYYLIMYFTNTSIAGAPVLYTDQPFNPAPHQAKAYAEVRLLRGDCANTR